MKPTSALPSCGAPCPKARRGAARSCARALLLLLLPVLLQTPFASPAAAQVPQPLFTWGQSAPAAPFVFGFPTGVAVDDSTGEIYIADRNYERVSRYDADGNYLGEWDCKGCLGVEVNPVTRAVYVGRVDADVVQEHTPDGVLVRTIGAPGTGDGQFNDPRNLAIDVETGEIYVFDAKNSRIQVFDQQGVFLRKWGSQGSGPGEFVGGSGPFSVAFDPITRTVVTTDPRSNAVQRFDRQGNLLDFRIVPDGVGRGETRWMRDVEIDVNGDVIVPGSDNERMQVFSPDGATVAIFRGPHDEFAGPFHPRSIAVNRVTGVRYVAAAYAHRIDVFSPDNVLQFSFGQQEDSGLILNGPTSLTVLPGSGDVVVLDEKNFLMKRFTSEGEFVAEWGVSSRLPATVERINNPVVSFERGAITADSQGLIFHATILSYYSNPGGKYVQVIDADTGQLVDAWPAQFLNNSERTGVAVDEVNGRVFVSEPRRDRVAVYDRQGALLTFLPGLPSPAGLAWGPNGLYAADGACECIRRYRPDDLVQDLQWGSAGTGPGEFNFDVVSGLAIDPDGRLFVADSRNDRIQAFSADGQFLFQFGSRGRNFGEFREPTGIAIDGAADRLYVTDTRNDRVYAYALNRRSSP